MAFAISRASSRFPRFLARQRLLAILPYSALCFRYAPLVYCGIISLSTNLSSLSR
jgi:hypothetical protein